MNRFFRNSTRSVVLGFSAILVMAALVLGFVGFKFFQDRTDAVYQQKVAMDTKNRELDAKISTLKDQASPAKAEALKERVVFLGQKFPSEASQDELARTLLTRAAASNVSLTSVTVLPPTGTYQPNTSSGLVKGSPAAANQISAGITKGFHTVAFEVAAATPERHGAGALLNYLKSLEPCAEGATGCPRLAIMIDDYTINDSASTTLRFKARMLVADVNQNIPAVK